MNFTIVFGQLIACFNASSIRSMDAAFVSPKQFPRLCEKTVTLKATSLDESATLTDNNAQIMANCFFK